MAKSHTALCFKKDGNAESIKHFPKVLDDETTVIDVKMHSSPDADIAVKSRLY